MNPFLEQVLAHLRDLNQQHGAIHARELAEPLGKSERTVRQYLSRLESQQLIARPLGPRGGWLVPGVPLPAPTTQEWVDSLRKAKRRARYYACA